MYIITNFYILDGEPREKSFYTGKRYQYGLDKYAELSPFKRDAKIYLSKKRAENAVKSLEVNYNT